MVQILDINLKIVYTEYISVLEEAIMSGITESTELDEDTMYKYVDVSRTNGVLPADIYLKYMKQYHNRS